MSLELTDEASLEIVRTQYPRWTDLAAVQSSVLRPSAAPDAPACVVPAHPLFEPWRAEIEQTGALAADLRFGPAPTTDAPVSLGGGCTAFFSERDVAPCQRCGGSMTLCFQLAPSDLAPWAAIDGLLTVLYCFACRPRSAAADDLVTREPFDGWAACRITREQPVHLVTLPATGATIDATTLGFAPRWDFPKPAWNGPLDVPGTAAHAMLIGEEVAWRDASNDQRLSDEYLALVFPEGGYRSSRIVDPAHLRRLPRDGRWRSTLGGFPSWDQDYSAFTCERCRSPMPLLLDYNGGLFLDGTLHVFTCVANERCRADHVVEFAAEF